MELKIISGGQTGIDQLALEIAKGMGIPTGGTAPRNYMTEDGKNYDLRDLYGLSEHSQASYPPRTEKNVINSGATVWFGSTDSLGYRSTLGFCNRYRKMMIENPDATRLRAFIEFHKISVLNVAGNRGSKLTVLQIDWCTKVLTEAFEQLLYAD
jgi:hypothetical protein